MNRYDLADDDKGVLGSLADAGAHMVRRNPALFGWGLAALVVAGYASLNALALQERAHPSALFATRLPAPETNTLAPDERFAVPKVAERPITRIVFSGETQATSPVSGAVPVAPAPVQGAPLAELQELLSRLGHYDGKIDGLDGPRTRGAIDAYKNAVGLRGIELTTEELLKSARNNALVTAAIPQVRPAEPQAAPEAEPATVRFAPPSAVEPAGTTAPSADPMVMKVQAGLRAFGNTGIEVDGLAGGQTRAAIREFQSLFRLDVNGEITPELIDKMTAVGLID